MKNDRSPIEYGKLACDALMHRFAPEKLPPETVLFLQPFYLALQNLEKNALPSIPMFYLRKAFLQKFIEIKSCYSAI